MLEPPHTEKFPAARNGVPHRPQARPPLRLIARLCGFAIPALATLIAIVTAGASGIIAAALAVASAALGLVVDAGCSSPRRSIP